MNTIPQMIKALKDAIKRIEALEAAAIAAKQVDKPVDKPPVEIDLTPVVRRGRPPKAVEPDPVEPAPEATAEI